MWAVAIEADVLLRLAMGRAHLYGDVDGRQHAVLCGPVLLLQPMIVVLQYCLVVQISIAGCLVLAYEQFGPALPDLENAWHYNRQLVMIRKKDDSLLNKIKRVVFQSSHLSPYLFLIAQTFPQKIERIIEDKSLNNERLNAAMSNLSVDRSQSSFIDNVLFAQNRCWDPCGRWLLLWYVVVFAAIMYYFVEMGIMITYGLVAWQWELSNPFAIAADVIFIVVFVIDMLVQFKTGFFYRGVIITDRARVVGRYLHYYFIFDIVLVVILVVALISQSYAMNYVKLVVVFKFIRMLELNELYMRRLAVNRTVKVLYVIGKQIITLFILSHTIGLFFYLIDIELINSPMCSQAAGNSGLCWLNSATTFSPILSYDWQIQYFYTLYWGINTITTISYGDIAPNNPVETEYAIYCMCFGFIVYGYVVNNIIKVILWSKTLKDQYRAEIIIMDKYMRTLKVKLSVQEEMRDYIEYLHLDEMNRNYALQNEMKAKLPEDLRFELLKQAYGQFYDNLVHIFPNNPQVIGLLSYVQQKQYTSNEVVLMQGAFVNKLYYLHRGQIRLQCTFNHAVFEISKMNTVDQFVALYEFLLKERMSFNVSTEKGAIVYFIDGSKIIQQTEKPGELRQKFKLVEYELRYIKNYEAILHYCYFCRGNHNWKECEQKLACFNKPEPHPTTRQDRPSYNVLKERSRLGKLGQFAKGRSDPIIAKIENRLLRLKEEIERQRKNFQLDVAYEWTSYLPAQNLSCFKEKWNHLAQERKYTLFGAYKAQALS